MEREGQTLPRQIQHKILEYIENNHLEPGDRLPTEPELCVLFGVSRTPLRESMKYLEIMGIVSVERSKGTFVRRFDATELLARLPMRLFYQRDEFLQMTQIRMILEEHCLLQAIGKGTDEDFSKLKASIEEMRLRAEHGESMLKEDIAFHNILADISRGGSLLRCFLQVLWDLRLRLPTDDTPAALWERYERHNRLYLAIHEHDTQMARVYLTEHFRGAYDDLLYGMKKSASTSDAVDET